MRLRSACAWCYHDMPQMGKFHTSCGAGSFCEILHFPYVLEQILTVQRWEQRPGKGWKNQAACYLPTQIETCFLFCCTGQMFMGLILLSCWCRSGTKVGRKCFSHPVNVFRFLETFPVEGKVRSLKVLMN